MNKLPNIFSLTHLPTGNKELFESIFESENLHIERIVSNGQVTPEGQWYDQERHEWVVLLQGNAIVEFEDGRSVSLERGENIFINPHEKHRVTHTSTNPACIWLAIHFQKQI
jgi:cupin 2 domain-containing protein